MPTPRLARVAEAAERIEERLRTDEAQARLEPTPRTDPGLVAPRTLEGADLAAGDFVRWARQVIDVLGQLANVPGDTRRSRACRRAADLVSRGVVATSLPAASAPRADED